jgi:putative transcriptional regulator
MALSNAIRRYRFDQGEMTQKELAEIVGVSRQTINAIEGNKYSPSLVVAFRIAHAFGYSVDDVFEYESDIAASFEIFDDYGVEQ